MTSRNWFLLVSLILVIELFVPLAFSSSSDLQIGQIVKVGQKTEVVKNDLIYPDSQKIYFVGDLMLARNVERRLVDSGVRDALSNFLPFWSNEFVVANFESAVPIVHLPTPDFTFQFSVNKILLLGLQASGVTHVSLANNHAFDFGVAGYQNTVTEIDNVGITTFGHPYILGSSSVTLIPMSDREVAVIGLNLIANEIDFEGLKKTIEQLSQTTALQIVYVHWGEEYQQMQSQSQRNIATQLAEIGVDMIVGHHPHVMQGVEYINNTLVFYSLGNFLFDQYFSAEVQNGLMLALQIKPQTFEVAVIPVSSENSKVKPFILEGESKTKILEKLSELSDESLKNSLLAGELVLPLTLATSTEVVIMAQ